MQNLAQKIVSCKIENSDKSISVGTNSNSDSYLNEKLGFPSIYFYLQWVTVLWHYSEQAVNDSMICCSLIFSWWWYFSQGVQMWRALSSALLPPITFIITTPTWWLQSTWPTTSPPDNNSTGQIQSFQGSTVRSQDK